MINYFTKIEDCHHGLPQSSCNIKISFDRQLLIDINTALQKVLYTHHTIF